MSVVHPIGDKVLLMFPQRGRYEGGIFVQGGTPRRMDAVVVDKGARVSDAIRTGATVVLDVFAGIPVSIDGVDYRLVPEREILADTAIGGGR